MHIPKTSGMGMIDLLSSILNARHEGPVFDRSLFGAFTAFDTIAPSIRERIHIRGRLPADGGNLIAGHLALSTLTAICPDADRMTVLREPRSRVLSHWVYWRALSDDELALWGHWAAYLKQAREPLKSFLNCPEIACHTDNLITRMLLWQHPLIPVYDFIKEENDEILLSAASTALEHFAFVDTIENPRFQANLQAWFAQPLEYPETNRTRPVSADLQSAVETELSDGAFKLLERRTRLDRHLWSAVAKRAAITDDVARFATNTLMRDIARFSRLMGTPGL